MIDIDRLAQWVGALFLIFGAINGLLWLKDKGYITKERAIIWYNKLFELSIVLAGLALGAYLYPGVVSWLVVIEADSITELTRYEERFGLIHTASVIFGIWLAFVVMVAPAVRQLVEKVVLHFAPVTNARAE